MAKKITVNELRKQQMALCDSLILDTDKMDEIMRKHTQKLIDGEFHNYSINNILLADAQLYQRTGETSELLSPYKKWGKVNRHVKRGEKALFVLAPIFFDEEQEDGTVERKMWFKKVPVFDLSQTEGDKFEPNYVKYEGNITFADVVARCTIPIIESQKQLTRGYTDGEKIWISKYIPDAQKICVLFHEMAHYYLHFDKDRNELTSATKEMDAECISYMISAAIGIQNDESAAYIRSWAGNNSHELIKNKGSKLIRTAQKIIDDLDLVGLLEEKSD